MKTKKTLADRYAIASAYLQDQTPHNWKVLVEKVTGGVMTSCEEGHTFLKEDGLDTCDIPF